MEIQMVQEVSVYKVNVFKKEVNKKIDLVAKETPLHIFLNRIRYATILCTPCQLQELVIGHLFSEGLLKKLDEIKSITIEESLICRVKLARGINVERLIEFSKPYARLITSACGSTPDFAIPKLIDRISLKKLSTNFMVNAKIILESTQHLNKIAKVFRKTGGTHVAALFDSKGNLIAFAEDIGRHNAVDKAIGSGLLKNTSFDECFLALSGRLNAEIVLKAARVGIPIVASLAAPINSGIEIANQADITLIGFARGQRINIYTNPRRIILEK
jgi:FdhD protein